MYFQNGTFPELGIKHRILIDKELQEFAIGMEDGTIFVTSDKMLLDYLEKLVD